MENQSTSQSVDQPASSQQRLSNNSNRIKVKSFGHRLVSILKHPSSLSVRKKQSLLDAVSDRDFGKVRSLLKRGVDPNTEAKYENNARRTALYISSANGDVDIARELLIHGANPYKGYNHAIQSETPFFASASSGHLEVVQLLLDAGVDLNYGFQEGSQRATPLFSAVNEARLEVCRELILRGADINIGFQDDCSPFDKASPLMIASINENLKLVVALLIGGANPNLGHWTPNETLGLPAEIATRKGCWKIVIELGLSGAFLEESSFRMIKEGLGFDPESIPFRLENLALRQVRSLLKNRNPRELPLPDRLINILDDPENSKFFA